MKAICMLGAAAVLSGCATAPHLTRSTHVAPDGVPVQTNRADVAAIAIPALPKSNPDLPTLDSADSGVGTARPRVFPSAAQSQGTSRPRSCLQTFLNPPSTLDLVSNGELRTALDLAADTDGPILVPTDPASAAIPAPAPPETNPFSKDYFNLLVADVKETFTAPARWEPQDWLVLGAVAAGIGTVAVFDQDIQRAVQSARNPTLDSVFNAVQPFGAEYAAGVLGAFYVGGAIFSDTRAKAVALDGASASLIASGLILYPLKYSVGRARPGANLGPYNFQPFSGHDSFPSGHTTEAFTVATVIAEHYDSLWIKFASYGLASMVGYARLNSNAHWASDVLTGAAIGTCVGHVVVRFNEKHWNISIQPVVGPTLKGAQFSFSF